MIDRSGAERQLGAVHSKRLPGNHLDFCRFAKRWDFGWVELKYEALLERRESLTRDAGPLAAFAARNDLQLSVHAAYDDPINIGARDRVTRDESRSMYRASLEYAARIGARWLTLHGGHIGRREYTLAGYREVISWTHDALRDLATDARGRGITLCVENRHRFDRRKLRYPTYPNEMQSCRGAVGDELRFTIDSGHANAVRGWSYEDFVRRVGPEFIGLTHLHDNDGTADQHRVPGEGTVGFVPFLRAWLEESWSFPLLLELNSVQDFVHGRARLRMWLHELESERVAGHP
jgi:sugar phosphate isomerase/epimerase